MSSVSRTSSRPTSSTLFAPLHHTSSHNMVSPRPVPSGSFQQRSPDNQPLPTYSTSNKSFCSPVPSNAQIDNHAPVHGKFSISRMPQTDILDAFSQNHKNPCQRFNSYEVSLSQTLKRVYSAIGILRGCGGSPLGTCTLISNNFAILARHTIEGRDIRGLKVEFGYVKNSSNDLKRDSYELDCIVEESASLDYAIVALKNKGTFTPGKLHGYIRFDKDDLPQTELALLHYPLGKPLKISVHTFVQTSYPSSFLETYHDSDYDSSGGAYLDPRGRLVALHLGSEIDPHDMNLRRYALPISMIILKNPHGVLARLCDGRLQQNRFYFPKLNTYYLSSKERNFLLDEEGYESKKILTAALKEVSKTDKKIKKNKDGTVTLSKKNLFYIYTIYPNKFKKVINECLNIGGEHGVTKQYSIASFIESDHLLPYEVYSKTTNKKLKEFIKGGGKRKGENELPAVTIPYNTHRILKTTGSSAEAKRFREIQVKLCNDGNVEKAISLSLKEYNRNGLISTYKEGIKKTLKLYEEMKIITTGEKDRIINDFKL